jgi:hypothetical protein
MGPLNRRLRALERRVGTKEFRAGAPPLDADGLPDWTGSGLSLDAYARLLDQDMPDADLSAEELETRNRLSPYREVFARLERAEEEDTVT